MVVLVMILTKMCLVPYLADKQAELLDHITESTGFSTHQS